MLSDVLEGWTDGEILATIEGAFGDKVEVNVGNVADLFTRAMRLSSAEEDWWRAKQ